MAIFNDVFCQICDRFYTEDRWNKHLYSSRHLHREVNGYWPAFFPQRKLTRDEGVKLEKAFWEVILTSNENDLALYDFLKLYFRMCTNIIMFQFVCGLMIQMKKSNGVMGIEMIW